MTSLPFHIFCSPIHTSTDQGPKLCMHNLIHDIKRIYRCKFLSDTLCRNCGTWVISHDSLEIKTTEFTCTFQILGRSNSLCKIFVQTHYETFVPLFVMFPTTLQRYYDNNL